MTNQAQRATPLTTQEIIELAELHVTKGAMASSAKLALADAKELLAEPNNFHNRDHHARMRALCSLSYSVGIFHPDYRRACAS